MGAKRGLLARGIGEVLDQPEGATTVRDRRLSHDEMAAVLRALDAAGGYGRVMRWLFWTGCRLNEACHARWRDVDRITGLWIVPMTKQGGTHVVPLPEPALAFLRTLLPGGDGDARLDPDPAALIFPNKRGGVLDNFDRATKAVHAASGTAGWHRHDIRRSVASLMGDLGVSPHVIEACLGHALRTSSDGSGLSKMAAVYNRSRYRAEHADALARLAAELHRIEHGADNVVRMVRS